jgi:hypothetical protein
MATGNSTTFSTPFTGGHSGWATEFRANWRRFFATAFNPYRPELHYMRGPGPAWRAKHGMEAPFRLKPREL